MSDEIADEISPVYPKFPAPTAYVDGVANLNYSREVVRFYMMRLDPSINALGGAESNVGAQIVMPLSGFLEMVKFFNSMLNDMVKAGHISTEDAEGIAGAYIPQSEDAK